MNPRLRFKKADGTDYPDWKEKKLGEVCNIYDGTHQTPNYTKTGIKFVSVENINDLYLSQKFISEEDFEKNYKIYPQKGDILMTRIGDIGTPALVSKDEKIAFYVSLALFKPNNIINPKFFVQALQSNFVRQEFWIRTLHTAFPKKINKKDIGICKLFLPCLEEQEKIGDFLSDIDEFISLSDQEVKKLQELKKGAMQKIFSQEIRFKKDDGTNYPDWEEKKLTEQADFLQGLTYSPDDVSKNGTLVLRSSNIQNDFISHEDEVYVNIDIPNKLKVKENDILMCVRNGSKKLVGKTALITKKEIGSSWGAFMMIIRPKCNTLFLYQYFKTDFFRKQIFNDLNTATINQITKNNINGCKLFLPCLEEQQKIADCLSAFDEAISLSKQELDKWKLLKKGFLQQMFV